MLVSKIHAESECIVRGFEGVSRSGQSYLLIPDVDRKCWSVFRTNEFLVTDPCGMYDSKGLDVFTRQEGITWSDDQCGIWWYNRDFGAE